jgi:hypothetical protein
VSGTSGGDATSLPQATALAARPAVDALAACLADEPLVASAPRSLSGNSQPYDLMRHVSKEAHGWVDFGWQVPRGSQMMILLTRASGAE